MKLLRTIPIVVGVLCAISASRPAQGSSFTATTTFQVTATVPATCTVSANTLSFGSYSGASNLDGSTTITVTCTNGTSYEVALDAGANGTTAANRKMANGGSTLNYSLYSDSGRSSVWGFTQGGDTVTGAGTGTAQTLTVYGRVPASQTPPAGTYTDTVGVTVYY